VRDRKDAITVSLSRREVGLVRLGVGRTDHIRQLTDHSPLSLRDELTGQVEA
jgi:hypothetical protein